MKRKLIIIGAALALALGIAGCDQTALTAEQLAQYQAMQKAQAEQMQAKIAAVTQTVGAVTTAAAPAAAAIPAAQPIAPLLPLADNLAQILGAAALAGFGFYQKVQASKYKLASNTHEATAKTLVQGIEKAASADPTAGTAIKAAVTKKAAQNGTADAVHKVVQSVT